MSEPKRFIVEVWDDMTATEAFYYCMKASESGQISETAGKKHHCAVTSFNNGVRVYVKLNAKSEKFQVSKGRI